MSAMTTIDLMRELPGLARGLTRLEYDAIVGQGLLDDQKVELLRGVIVALSPTYRPHGLAVQWLTMWLARRLPEDLHVRVQSGWAATEDSEPEPDLAVVSADWAKTELVAQHPTEALLLIEVAESSLRRDLRIKSGIYAEAGLPVYWVFDTVAREIVVHTGPGPEGYAEVRRAGAGEVLQVAGVDVPIDQLLAFTFPNPEPPRAR